MKKISIFLALLVLTLVSKAQLTLGDSLIAYYPFSGNASDVTGNGYDGTIYGATLTTDRFGNANMAYDFDGIDDYINTFSIFDFEYRTLSLWVYSRDITGSGTSEKHVAGHDDDAMSYGQLKVKFDSNTLQVRSGGETNNQIYQFPMTEIWYHVVLVRDGANSYFYLNNVLIGVDASGNTASSAFTNPDFVIGAGRELTNQFFNGKIDDIRIYNRALSSSEVGDLFDLGNPLGIDNNLEDFKISLYPNPANSSINIEIPAGYEDVDVKIVDASGRLIFSQSKLKTNILNINSQSWSTGIYSVYIREKNGAAYASKFIIN
ncbi:MAG TPA: LamG-like jellyroll fold domain-containing protein, partial [Taishania sp.]|nr:LamG-like jellyroll fold domain-containing protein [Taishania sp.]